MNESTLPRYGFEVEPRTVELGGGWKLRLLIDGEEAGGGVFPADPADQEATDAAHAEAMEQGESWLGSIERRQAIYRPRPADDGGMYLLMPDDRLLMPPPADDDREGGKDA